MKNRSKLSILVGALLSAALLLASCGGGGDNPSSVSPSSGDATSDTSANPSTTTSEREEVSIPGVDDYEEWIDSWSQPGHLYFHYYRHKASEAEYAKYCVWLWEVAPDGVPGSLWGASYASVQARFKKTMSTSWMTNIGGKGINKDSYGHILDVDLSGTVYSAETGKPWDKYLEATKIGFLIVDQTSMGGGSHWTSDGSANMFIENFNTHWRSNGAMHVFCTKGSVDQYSFVSGAPVTPNPTVTDTTGQYRSKSDLDSSATIQAQYKTSNKFKNSGVGYQVFVGSYRDSDDDGRGDINGITASINDGTFEDLGVQVLWLTPIQTCESYHGYDAIDYFSIDSRFGTMKDYKAMLNAAHAKGMVVLMDLVLNHSAKNNIWFKNSQKAVNENGVNYRDVYHWKYKGDKVLFYDGETEVYKEINVEDHKDWYRDGESNYYYYGKFGSGMPEFNYDSSVARTLVTNLAKYWLSVGVDGFRLDAVKHIYMKDEVPNAGNDIIIQDIANKSYYDTEKKETVTELNDYSSDLTKNLNFWNYFANTIKADYPDCFLVGENFDGYGQRVAPYYQALDSQFDFSTYYHTYEWTWGGVNGMKPEWYATSQQSETYTPFTSAGPYTLDCKGEYYTYDEYNVPTKHTYSSHPVVSGGNRKDFINGAFTSNHDVLRAMNHVNGDNTAMDYESDNHELEVNKAKVLAELTILQPGISWIYYGDEIGMTSNTNKHVELYGNENCEDIWYRSPYKWGDDKITPHYTDGDYVIEWDDYTKLLPSYADQKASSTNNDMLDVYTQLCAAKRMYGKSQTYQGYSFDTNTSVVHFTVSGDSGTYRVYIHTGVDNQNNVNISVNSSAKYVNGAHDGILVPYSTIVVKA